MNLNKLKTLLETDISLNGNQLSGSFNSGSSSISIQDVDWNFPEVTIIMPPPEGGDGKGPKPPKKTPDSSKTEFTDPPPPGGGEGEGDGDSTDGESGGDETNQIKIGSIIQDFKTGEYGRVTDIDGAGGIEWEPVSKEELEVGGYLAKRVNTATPLNRSVLDGLIG